jgi:hypothetical protein
MLDPDPYCGHTVQKVVEFIIKIKTNERRSLLPRIAPYADVLPQAAEHDELRPARHQAVQDRLLRRFRAYTNKLFKNPTPNIRVGNSSSFWIQLFPTTVPTKEKELDQ